MGAAFEAGIKANFENAEITFDKFHVIKLANEAVDQVRREEARNNLQIKGRGFVTLPCREREVSAPQELLGSCDCSPPRCHRDTAKRAVRLGGDEMALDVGGVVDGAVG